MVFLGFVTIVFMNLFLRFSFAFFDTYIKILNKYALGDLPFFVIISFFMKLFVHFYVMVCLAAKKPVVEDIYE